MSEALEKAEAAAREASVNSAAVQIALAAVELAKAAQAQPAAQPHACEHQHKKGRSASEWLGIGFAVCVGSVGLALGFLAVAIVAPCATACLLVLRSMWRDYQKGR